MSPEIKDADGNVVGVIPDDSAFIVDRHGVKVGWIAGDDVYCRGVCVGRYINGRFLDPNGRIVARTDDAEIDRFDWSPFTFDEMMLVAKGE